MNDKNLLLEIDKEVATITLNRLDAHNAFDSVLIDSLSDAIQFCMQQESVRVIILTANGSTFSAGADLNWMRNSMAMSYEDNINDAKRFAALLRLFKNCPKPTIVKVNGPAYGGAIGIICCCDIVIASEQSRFCFSEVKLGLIPATISPYVIAIIGEKAAKRYFVTAEVISAEKAKELGMVDDILPKQEIDRYCQQIVDNILANKPIAVSQAKKLVNQVLSISESDLETETAKMIADIRVSNEAQTALNEFFAQRDKK